MLEILFDQDESVAIRDFVHVFLACLHGLGNIFNGYIQIVKHLINQKVKTRLNIFLAADGTKVGLIWVCGLCESFMLILRSSARIFVVNLYVEM